MRARKGQLLVAAAFVTVIVAMLGLIAVSLISGESFSSLNHYYGVQALNVAEGGIRFTLATFLAADADWSDNTNFGPVSLEPGTFSIVYLAKSKNNCTLESTATVQGVSRTVRLNFNKQALPKQFTDYGVHGGEGGSSGDTVVFSNDSKIIGSFFFYGNVQILGSRPPPCQTVGTIKSITISTGPGNWWDYYTSWEAATTVEAVNWDNSYYDYWLNVADKAGVSNITMTGNDNIDLNGGTVWHRNITMRDNSSFTGPGTVCATGVIQTSNTAHFNGPVRLISINTPASSMKFNDNTYWTGTPEIIALDNLEISNNVVTPPGSILYSKASGSEGIKLSLNAVARGSLFAPYGRITSNNNASIEGLSYSYDYQAIASATHRGGAVFRRLGSFYNQTRIIQDADVLPAEVPEGISVEAGTAGLETLTWEEIY